VQSAMGAGHELRRHTLDPLLASLALFDSAEDLEARVHTLFNVRVEEARDEGGAGLC
jgi:hypothetical protein